MYTWCIEHKFSLPFILVLSILFLWSFVFVVELRTLNKSRPVSARSSLGKDRHQLAKLIEEYSD